MKNLVYRSFPLTYPIFDLLEISSIIFDYIRKNPYIEKELIELTQQFVELSKERYNNAVDIQRDEIFAAILQRNLEQSPSRRSRPDEECGESQGYQNGNE